jgi:hypothetical protein
LRSAACLYSQQITMLTGIKRGKKKQKREDSEANVKEKPQYPERSDTSTSQSSERVSVDSNAAAAEALRQSLATGDVSALLSDSHRSSTSNNNNRNNKSVASRNRESVWSRLERQGRIHSSQLSMQSALIVEAPRSYASHLPADEKDMTPAQLALAEQRESSLAESLARAAVRQGKHNHKRLAPLHKNDSDDDDEIFTPPSQTTTNDSNTITRKQQKYTQQQQIKEERRHQAREHSRYDRQSQLIAHCSWWMAAPTFVQHRLLALGHHASLSMMAPSQSLVVGQHFSIVPIPLTPSMAAAAPEVRQEVLAFLTSLRSTFAPDCVIAWETVLNSSSSSSSRVWQTEWQAVVIPRTMGLEASLFFQSALAAQAEEWSTHPTVLRFQSQPPWYTRLPTQGDYFYVNLADSNTTTTTTKDACVGLALLIESRNAFPKDLGVDTLAALMDIEPLRMRRKKQQQISQAEEMRYIHQFLDAYEPHDWT